MIDSPVFSIIIPIYNAERFLRRCLESICEQTYTNFEVLMCNDGSTDQSQEICSSYSASDKRFKLFTQPNGGVSSARNLGLDNASGKYVLFVDADDYISPDFLEEMLPENECDIILQGADHLLKDGRHSITYPQHTGACDRTQFVKEALRNTSIQTPWGKRYTLEVIHRHSLRFRRGIQYGEDKIFVAEYIAASDSFFLSQAYGYTYMHDNNSALTRQSHSGNMIYQYALACANAYDKLLSKVSLPSDLKDKAVYPFLYDAILSIHTTIKDRNINKKHKQDFIAGFDKKLLRNAVRNKFLPMRFKVLSFCCRIFPLWLILFLFKSK